MCYPKPATAETSAGVYQIFNAAAFTKTRFSVRELLNVSPGSFFFLSTLEVVEEVAFNEMEGLLFLSFVSFIRLTRVWFELDA